MNAPTACVLAAFFLLSALGVQAQDSLLYPNGHPDAYPGGVGPQPDGSILVPTNQRLRPAGSQVYIPGRPVDVALSPDEKFLVVKDQGDLELIRVSDRAVMQTLPYPRGGASFTGICFSADGRRIFTAGAGDRLWVAALDADNILHWDSAISLPHPSIGGEPVPGGLVLDETGNTIYVTLSRNNTLAIIDTKTRSVVAQVPVGVAPYDVRVTADHKAYVSNWGGRKPLAGESVYPSSGSPVLVDPTTGIASDGSVSVVDLDRRIVTKTIKVGLHPSGMVVSPGEEKLYVACANSDIIAVIDTKTDKVIDTISVHIQKGLPFGSAPNALALSPDGQWLYAANGTDNAVAVIRTGSQARVAGYIPTGWYPGAVVLNKSGRTLFVANLKGIGSRNLKTEQAGYSSLDGLGSVSIIPVPGPPALAAMTDSVHRYNSYAQMLSAIHRASGAKTSGEKDTVAVPQWPGQVSCFRHVIYIIRENRTYDQVLGDLPQGNGDTSLVEFGERITPNAHRLASSFVLMDNFNCSGILSADGHQWADEAYATDYIEKSFAAGFPRSYPFDGDDAMAYASSGFIWDDVLTHGLTFRDYGEFVHATIHPSNAGFSAIYQDFMSGTNKIKIRAKATLDQLGPYICPDYIGFPQKVPDIYRAATFIKELKGYERTGSFPSFVIMELPNDHTSGLAPGMPVPQASVADNDLALGEIVQAVSHSKFWKETCIFVTEDDPQSGLDHVDGHRTVGLVISPYTKRGKVISHYYSQINMVRTIEDILGIPPMNELDWSAEAMMECFSNTPDYTPYRAEKNNIPLDSMNHALSQLKGKPLYWAKKSMEQDLDDADLIEDDVFNRIIWYAVKGYDKPYPSLSNRRGR